MRPYPTDSPQAMARILTLALIADGNLDNRELDTLDRHRIPQTLGVSRDAFIEVMLGCCRDLLAAGTDQVSMLDARLIDPLLDEVRSPRLRLAVCSAVLVLAKADGDFSGPEQALLTHAMRRWSISLEEIAAFAQAV